MRQQFLFTAFIFVCIAAFWSTIPIGCANIIPPEGGPRDSLPPVLVDADPADSTVNFRGKSITLTFDEYIDLKDVQNNLLFTPTFQTNPAIAVRGKNIVIPFKDQLEPNTTYVLNFGNAIVDMNESNVLRNFTYTFSTGPVLDSLEISGRVILAETGAKDTTLIAGLYKNLTDSAVYKNRPLYVVRLDGNGAFRFHNLPKDTFAIYILGDAIGRRYNNKNQLFAFSDAPVVAGETDSLLLYAYRETPAAPTGQNQGQAPRIPNTDRRLRFTQSTTGQQDLLTDYSLLFSTPLRTFDSTKVQLTTDSAFNPANYSVALDTSAQVLSFRTKWKENTKYNLVLDKDFAIDTNGRQLLKTDTLFFTTKKEADYGSITLRFRNLDLSRKPVLQFVLNNAVQFSAPLTSNIFNRSLIVPADYNLRIVYDTNGNGRWDAGQFFGVKKQPEMVQSIDRTISIKPAFDNEVEIQL